MKKTVLWCLLCAAVALAVGYALPRPTTAPAVKERRFRDELHELTTAHARELQDSLKDRYDDPDECRRIYQRWKYRRHLAVDELYRKYDRVPPD